MSKLGIVFLLILIPVLGFAQDGGLSRGSIPEALVRPRRGETPRFPVDTVIGPLGRGDASNAAYAFAREIADSLLSGNLRYPQLEDHLIAIDDIAPRSYRLGSGRNEVDGSVSFLIRFLGREQGITGELFVRYATTNIEEVFEEGEEIRTIIRTVGSWTFDDLILEEARSREEEHRDSLQRFDFSPYQRFF